MALDNEASEFAYFFDIPGGGLNMTSPAKNVIKDHNPALVGRVLQKVGQLF